MQCVRANGPQLLAVLFAALLHILWQGYSFGSGNHAVQIPFLKSYLDPALYPNDLLLSTLPRYATFYYALLSYPVKLFGHIEILFFALHLLTDGLLLYVIYRLANALFRNRATAAISVMLMLPPAVALGAERLYYQLHTHTGTALPLLVWALALFLDGRIRTSFLVAGLTANIHSQASGFVFAMLAFASLANARHIGRRTVLEGWILYILSAGPCLAWTVLASDGPATDAWLQQLRARSGFHAFPFSFEAQSYRDFLLYLALGVMAWAAAWHSGAWRALHKTVALFALAIVLLSLVGVVFAEWVPVKLILKAQLFRSSRFLTIFVLLYAAHAIWLMWLKGRGFKALAVLSLAMLFFPRFFLFLPLPLFFIALQFERTRRWWLLFACSATAAALLILPAGALLDNASLSSIAPALFNGTVRLILLACLTTFLLWQMRVALPWSWARGLATAIACSVLLMALIPAAYRHFHHDIHAKTWVAVQLWAKDNTPRSAVFITPPYLAGFRAFSERSTVAEWKDGTQQFFDSGFSNAWWARMADLPRERDKYGELPEGRLRELARKYGASYVIMPAARTLSLPLVYGNRRYRVYALTMAPGPARPNRPGSGRSVPGGK